MYHKSFKYRWLCPVCGNLHEQEYDPAQIGRQTVECPVTHSEVKIVSRYFRHPSPNCNGEFCWRLPESSQYHWVLSTITCPSCGRMMDRKPEPINPPQTLVPDDIPAAAPVAAASVAVFDLRQGPIGSVEPGRRATIGRGIAADIRLDTDDTRVSRLHLAVDLTGRTPLLEVLGLNGITVDGAYFKRDQQIPLPLDKKISIYDINLILHSK